MNSSDLAGRASNGDGRRDELLAFVDQGFYVGHRVTGQKEVTQCTWVYEHPVDFDGVKRFHHNLGHGLLARHIERSPLPFGRYRWVTDPGPPGIDIADRARPRAEVSDWADERARLPIDPERGAAWHLGVLPLTDGSTAISLVVSHYLIDGIGFAVVVAEAIMGKTRDLGYPPPHSRTRLRAVVEDARQTVRDFPEMGRAAAVITKQVAKQFRQRDVAKSAVPQPIAFHASDSNDAFVVPGITIQVGVEDWDARAKALGATSNTLVAGLAAKLAEYLGRRPDGDGAVTVQLPMSERADGDTRAVAVSFARVRIDPTAVTKDLREVRADIKQAMAVWKATPDESAQLASLVPFTPKRMWIRGVEAGPADPDRPVICSNLGDVGSVVCLLDGTPAEYMSGRGTRQHVTRQELERAGGQLYLLTMRVGSRISINVSAYQPGAENTKAALRELAARALVEFELTGEID
jgi:hypothetical protein